MTTIVYRNGFMCADTRAYSGDKVPIGTKTKIKSVNGVLVGVSTRCPGIGPVVLDWFAEGMPGGPGGLKDRLPFYSSDDGFTFLAVHPDGRADYMLGYAVPTRISADYYAIGSGEAYAIGAMEHGATAIEAALIACRLDVWSAEPIDMLTHSDPVPMRFQGDSLRAVRG